MAGVNLVTGGSGFIGSHLVDRLIARGETVRVLDLCAPRTARSEVEFVKGSVTRPADVASAVKGVRRVFHLAAKAGLWARRPRTFYEVNQEGTRNVLRAAVREGVEKIVHCSTESVLKSRRHRPGPGRTDETVSWTADDMPGHYCRAKFLAEQEALRAAQSGAPVVVVNPTVPMGPGDWNLTPPSRMILGFLNGKFPTYLETTLNMVDARDVAMGHVLAAEKGSLGQRYILGNTNLRLSDLLGELGDLTGLAMPRYRIPYAVAFGFSALGELISNFITQRPPAAPLTGVRLARTPNVFDNSKARTELGLSFRPLRVSLAEQIVWFQERGLLKRSLPRQL